MDYKKLLINAISVLMALLIPLIIFLYNFNSAVFDRDYYKKEFSKYNVYENLKDYDAEKINNDTLNYFISGKNNGLIENNFFNEREKMHLLDVKNLIQGILLMYYFSITLFFLFFFLIAILMGFNFKNIFKKFLIISLFGSSTAFLAGILLAISSNLNFDFVFGVFHKTFFNAGTFIFNPEFERIVALYPQNLFLDFLIRIISNAIISSIILFFLCLAFLFIFFSPKFFKFFPKIPTENIRNRKV